MLKLPRLFRLREHDGHRTIVITIPVPKLHTRRFMHKLRLDYGFSIGLIIAGLTGLAINLIPLNDTTETHVASVVEPVQSANVSPGMNRSIPTRLEIPAIGVSTDLIILGKNTDGTLETPKEYNIAGWYEYSPTPGEIGPAIITGHVDNYLGPAMFYNLKDLVQGSTVKITRDDGTIANFVVDEVKVFDQKAFPTEEVYGNIDHSGLRLITCGGNYDVLSGKYSHNVVVYATYTKT